MGHNAAPSATEADDQRWPKELIQKVVDFSVRLSYMLPILAHEGASPETILKAERGVAFRGCGS
jgi:hypothetical protein